MPIAELFTQSLWFGLQPSGLNGDQARDMVVVKKAASSEDATAVFVDSACGLPRTPNFELLAIRIWRREQER